MTMTEELDLEYLSQPLLGVSRLIISDREQTNAMCHLGDGYDEHQTAYCVKSVLASRLPSSIRDQILSSLY